jgi:hypothetical protein
MAVSLGNPPVHPVSTERRLLHTLLPLAARSNGARWADLVRVLVERDVGVPIAYRSAADGQIRINPPPDTPIEADKLYVIVRENNNRRDDEIAALVGGLM